MYSHQNIMSINNNVFLKCMINVTYSYSPVVFNTTVNARILDESHISFNDIIDTLSKQIPLNNFAISYCEYDNNTETFVNCGKYPLENDILIGYNPSPTVPTYIRIKLRQIIKKENVLRMDVNEEDFENIDESKQHNFFNSKSKRAKERKIGYIIKKVYMWKTLYNGFIEEDEKGNKVSKELLENRLKDYIFTVGNRYAKDVCSVDVVNECISDKNFVLRDGNDHSKWFDIMGPEYVDKAFFWAKQAFPNSSLVINDYNLETMPPKREGMYNLVKGMLGRGVPVDTVGLQMHINLENPPVSEIEKTIELFGSLGLKVIVTEMDVSVYKDFQPGKESEPRKEYTPEVLQAQAERYKQIFDCFKKEADKGILQDVVLWGITDRFSWKNDFPVPGRTDAPLLFDVNGKPKPAFYEICR